MRDIYGEECLTEAKPTRKPMSYDRILRGSRTERQCQCWLASFRSINFSLEDVPGFLRPTEIDYDKIKAMIEASRRSTTQEITDKLSVLQKKCLQKNYSDLRQLGYVNKP